MAGHKPKKQKTAATNDGPAESSTPNTHKPSAVFRPTGGRNHTFSIALPGSIIANAMTHDLKTSLAGQIARACAVFCVDEIIVFDDGQAKTRAPEQGGYTAFADPNFFLYHVLTYLETPPHLRKALFPMHPDLRTAGALPSLDMPHHLRSHEWCEYREGVAVGPAEIRGKAAGTLIECGLDSRVVVPVEVDRDTRVTVQLPEDQPSDAHKSMYGEAVSSDAPRQQKGYFWGFAVRQASSLATIFTECPFDGGYDMSIGTSERGGTVDTIPNVRGAQGTITGPEHLLLVFGGVAGLEAALSADGELQAAGVTTAKDIFDHWINLVPGQGSRTIRTEEAVWIGLAACRQILTR